MRLLFIILLSFFCLAGNAPALMRFSGWENGTGRLDSYWTSGSLFNSPYDLMVVTADTVPPRGGTHAARFEVRYGDSYIQPNGKVEHPRAEVQNRRDSIAAGYTNTWQMSGWTPVYTVQNDKVPYLIFQMHDAGAIGSPYYGVTIYQGYYWYGINQYNLQTGVRTSKAWRLFPVVKGQWHDWQVYMKLRSTPDGRITLWHNGVVATGLPCVPSYGALTGAPAQLLDIQGANISKLENGAKDYIPYWKCGLYVWNANTNTQCTDYVIYIDNVAMYDSTYNPYDVLYKYNPIVNAGSDITIVQPASTAHLTSAVSGGTSPYSYLWTKLGGPTGGTILSPTVSQTDIQNLTVGSYQYEIRVTDAVGKIGRDTVQVTVNQAPNTPPVANAGNDTTITLPANSVFLNASLSTDNGTIVSYLWTKLSGPASGAITNAAAVSTTATGLVQGTYVFSVRVTDNNGATNTDTKQVTVLAAIPPPNQPPVANAGTNTTITLPTNTAPLNGSGSTDPDGSIVAYLWTKLSGPTATILNPTASVASAIGLVAGDYVFKLKVTDNNGDTGVATKLVTVNPAVIPPLVLNVTGMNVLCYGYSTGSATASVSGGVPPYAYLWSNNLTTSSITNVPAGGYSVKVTDANNSVKSLAITLTQPDTLIVNASYGTISLPSGTTTVVVSATGGKPPYTGTGTFTLQDTGIHTYPVSDANGCVSNYSINIPLTPTPMSLSLTPTNTLCFGYSTGSITSNVSGGVPPYKYVWTNGADLGGPDDDSSLTGLFNIPAGSYTLWVYDNNGDSITSTALVQDAPVLTAYETHTNIQYVGGTSTVTITSNGGTGAVTGTGTFVVTAGTYTYTVTDANSCTDTITVTIQEGAQRPIPKKYKIRKN